MLNYNKTSGDIQIVVGDTNCYTAVLSSYVGTLSPDNLTLNLKIILKGNSTITSDVSLGKSFNKLDRISIEGTGSLICESISATTVEINSEVSAKHINCNVALVEGGKLTSNNDPSSPLISAKGHIWFKDSVIQSSGYATCIKTPYLLVDNSNCNITATSKAIDTTHRVSRENCVSSTYTDKTFKTTCLLKDASGNPRDFLYVLVKSKNKLTQIASRRKLYGYTPAYAPLTEYDEFKESTQYTTPDLHRRINQNGEILKGTGSNYIPKEVIELIVKDLYHKPGLELEAIPDEVINAICANVYMIDGYLFTINNSGNTSNGTYTFNAKFRITDRMYIDSSRIDSTYGPVSDDNLKMSISFTSGYVEDDRNYSDSLSYMNGWSTKSSEEYEKYIDECASINISSFTNSTKVVNYSKLREDASNEVSTSGDCKVSIPIKIENTCTDISLAFNSQNIMFSDESVRYSFKQNGQSVNSAKLKLSSKILDEIAVKEYTKVSIAADRYLEPGEYEILIESIPFVGSSDGSDISVIWNINSSWIKDGSHYRDIRLFGDSSYHAMPSVGVSVKSVSFNRFDATVKFEVKVINPNNLPWKNVYAYFRCEGLEFKEEVVELGEVSGVSASLHFNYHPHKGDPITIENIQEIIAGTYIEPITNGYELDELKSRNYEVGIYSLNSYRTTEYFFHDENNVEYEEVP